MHVWLSKVDEIYFLRHLMDVQDTRADLWCEILSLSQAVMQLRSLKGFVIFKFSAGSKSDCKMIWSNCCKIKPGVNWFSVWSLPEKHPLPSSTLVMHPEPYMTLCILKSQLSSSLSGARPYRFVWQFRFTVVFSSVAHCLCRTNKYTKSI